MYEATKLMITEYLHREMALNRMWRYPTGCLPKKPILAVWV